MESPLLTVATSTSDDCCGICLDPFKDPVDTQCGHSFCSQCIRQVLRQEEQAPCPFCRRLVTLGDLRVHSTGKQLVPSQLQLGVVKEGVLVAPIGGAHFNTNYIQRVDNKKGFFASHGFTSLANRVVLTPDAWYVSSVCWFACGGEVSVPCAGEFDVSFRVMRLPKMRFGDLNLKLDGKLVRRATLDADRRGKGELRVGEWQLLHVGTVRLQGRRKVKAEALGVDQSWWKSGLLIDCMVVAPVGAGAVLAAQEAAVQEVAEDHGSSSERGSSPRSAEEGRRFESRESRLSGGYRPFENRRFGDNNKVIRSDRDGVPSLYLEHSSHASAGTWLTPRVFVAGPCCFGRGTWAAVFDSFDLHSRGRNGVLTMYSEDDDFLVSFPEDAAARARLANQIEEEARWHGQDEAWREPLPSRSARMLGHERGTRATRARGRAGNATAGGGGTAVGCLIS